MAALKYQQVKNYIIDSMQAENLKYGDPIPTESELMKMFDVSRHTVRRALSDLVNEGWLYTMQGSGTYVSDPNADMNISGKMVGIITTYFRDYIFPDIISGMDDVFSEEGYSLLLGTTKNNSTRERVVLNNMLNNQLAGLIVEPSKSVYPNPNIQLYRKFIERGIPVLFIHATYRALETSYIIQDDVYAGYIATKHLLDSGHKDILGIFKQDDMQGHGRCQGYQNALEADGVKTAEDYVKWFTTEDSLKAVSEENLKLWLSENPKVTAFVCYNDKLAVNLLNSLLALGYSVPQDYSIVSFDNSKLANTMVTKLTSVAHPKAELGEKAAHLLIELMKNPNQIFEEVMKPELVIGDSTRKI